MRRALTVWFGGRLRDALTTASTSLSAATAAAATLVQYRFRRSGQLHKPRTSDGRERKQTAEQTKKARKISPPRARKIWSLSWPRHPNFSARILDPWELRVCCSRFYCLRGPLCRGRVQWDPFPAVNREFKKSDDKKTKKLKLQDPTAQKDAKGGAGKSASSSNGSASRVPRSLNEFLKRDSLPIKR